MTNPFRTILVPHDLSAHATRALEMAAGLAGREGRLIVLHVANAYENAAVQEAVVADARRALDGVIARTIAARACPRVECRVETGDAYRKIAEAARGVDSIVMCTSGRTGVPHLLIGSVAEKVVRHAPVPVLTFRADAPRARHLFRSILVPHDFSAHARHAFRLAASLAGPHGRLIVLHVVSALPEMANRMGRQILSQERRRLARLVGRSGKERRAPTIECRVEAGDPYRHIAEAARDVDSIVMCTAGRTGLPHLLIGSVAEKVVRHVAVPLLSLRAGAARARRSRSVGTAARSRSARSRRRAAATR